MKKMGQLSGYAVLCAVLSLTAVVHVAMADSPQALIAPDGTINFIAKFDSAGNPTVNSLLFDNGANIGLGTTAPDTLLSVNSSAAGSQAVLAVSNGNADTRIGLWSGFSAGANPPAILYTHALRFGTLAAANFASGSSFVEAMRITSDGNVGIGAIGPDAKLHVIGPIRVQALPPNDNTQANAEFVLSNRGAGGAPYTWRLQTAAVGGGFGVNPNALEIWEYPQDAMPGCCLPRLRILPSGNQGSAVTPVTIMENGTLQTSVLQILGGSDLAEPFEIAEADSIQPGMVVAIDPERPGHLRIAEKAYDRTVAGIVSGANGINPGLTMKQAGSVADGSHPVSLTGRVYCRVDASYGSIEPGDLLTTSDTPGHAMKVTDHNKAQGAILGKAMTEWKQGKGLVLVLVTLQ